MPSEPHLVSFVLRFVGDGAPAQGVAADGTPLVQWRGVVRHVQSDAEQHFLQWEDALAFMERFVVLDGAEPGRS